MPNTNSNLIIYLIRHGETEYNRKGLVQGSGIDASLNEVGYAQAEAFYNHFKHIPFARVFTSKLKRTKQSVQHFIDAGIPWEEHEGLNEISWGTSEGAPLSAENDRAYYDGLQRWAQGETNIGINGGESPEQVAKRQQQFLEVLYTRPQESPVLICMHGRAMRILLCQLMGLPLKNMDLFEHRNLCLYKLHANTKGFEIRISNYVVHPPAPY